MPYFIETSLRHRILAFVLKSKKPLTIDRVLAEIARFISATQAQRAYDRQWRMQRKRKKSERKPIKDVLYTGRRKLISTELSRLAQEHKIRRVAPGIYAKLS